MLHAMIVDDEAPARSELRYLLEQTGRVETIVEAPSVKQAIECLMQSRADVVFLDISMPKVSGMQLAEALHRLKNPPAVVFVTAYKQFAYDAMSVRPSGYLLKPLTPEALLEEVVYAMTKVLYKPMNKGNRIVVRTFGSFDVFIDGELLAFSRSKSKEVLAFLVDQQGRGVRRSEIYEALWEDEEYGHRQQKYLDVIIRSLRETLKQAGISQILEMKRGLLRVLPGTFDCDLYRFVQGDPVAVRAYKGKYMVGYRWA